MLVYNNHLYIGEYEDIEIALEDVVFNKNVEFLAKNLEQSVSLYRMDKNENMELVVGDATEMFPNGGISGLSSGFGHHELSISGSLLYMMARCTLELSTAVVYSSQSDSSQTVIF